MRRSLSQASQSIRCDNNNDISNTITVLNMPIKKNSDTNTQFPFAQPIDTLRCDSRIFDTAKCFLVLFPSSSSSSLLLLIENRFSSHSFRCPLSIGVDVHFVCVRALCIVSTWLVPMCVVFCFIPISVFSAIMPKAVKQTTHQAIFISKCKLIHCFVIVSQEFRLFFFSSFIVCCCRCCFWESKEKNENKKVKLSPIKVYFTHRFVGFLRLKCPFDILTIYFWMKCISRTKPFFSFCKWFMCFYFLLLVVVFFSAVNYCFTLY